ncbi:hypothetical protein [uncultured Litoreibacter sp.]|uniref:hypothetical protein n=1 Tax=uncultured Litoreibacter sp. TaxID=1392394 RepID=UPI00261E4E5C|nr:hypothetical protein [uncultured Litoreibacter sp.]
MEISDFISLGALGISIAALVYTMISSRDQKELILRETELVRIQLEKEKAVLRESESAMVSARLYEHSKGRWKIRVFNTGPAAAKNVAIVADAEDSFITENELKRKFPVKKLTKGQHVELNAFIHLSSPGKETIRLIWEDRTGASREENVELIV